VPWLIGGMPEPFAIHTSFGWYGTADLAANIWAGCRRSLAIATRSRMHLLPNSSVPRSFFTIASLSISIFVHSDLEMHALQYSGAASAYYTSRQTACVVSDPTTRSLGLSSAEFDLSPCRINRLAIITCQSTPRQP